MDLNSKKKVRMHVNYQRSEIAGENVHATARGTHQLWPADCKPIPMKTGGTRDPHWHSRLLTDYFSLRQHSRVPSTSAQLPPFDLSTSRFSRSSLFQFTSCFDDEFLDSLCNYGCRIEGKTMLKARARELRDGIIRQICDLGIAIQRAASIVQSATRAARAPRIIVTHIIRVTLPRRIFSSLYVSFRSLELPHSPSPFDIPWQARVL
ncbi:unnamed protein product, partial [Heterotrigona itama]